MEAHSQYALLFVPMLAFTEACIGIGLFVSGAFLVAVASFILNYELASIELIALLAMIGASAGDHVGFYTGRLFGPKFHQSSLAIRYSTSLHKGEQLIEKYGAFAIFIGRFIPAIRSIIPALVGLSEFNKLRYSVYDILACALWALALALIVLGVDSLI